MKPIPKEKLDYQRIRDLLQAADHRWFATHSDQYNYQSYLDFVAVYIVKNYYREKKHADKR